MGLTGELADLLTARRELVAGGVEEVGAFLLGLADPAESQEHVDAGGGRLPVPAPLTGCVGSPAPAAPERHSGWRPP
jgi:hypothetical protein